jgi:hypothetical protein
MHGGKHPKAKGTRPRTGEGDGGHPRKATGRARGRAQARPARGRGSHEGRGLDAGRTAAPPRACANGEAGLLRVRRKRDHAREVGARNCRHQPGAAGVLLGSRGRGAPTEVRPTGRRSLFIFRGAGARPTGSTAARPHHRRHRHAPVARGSRDAAPLPSHAWAGAAAAALPLS